MPSKQEMIAEYLKKMQMDPYAPPITMESQIQKQIDAPMQMKGMTSGFAPSSPAPAEGLKGTVEGSQRTADAQRAYANQLRGRGAPQGRNAGPLNVYYGPNIGESLAYAGEQALAGYMTGQANEKDAEIDIERGLEKTRLEGKADAQLERDNTRKDETLEVQKAALAETILDGEGVVMVSPDGKSEANAVSRNGVMHEPDGTALWGQGDVDRKGWKTWKKPVTGSGGSGRHYVTKMTDAQGNEILTRLDPYDPNSLPEYQMIGEDGNNIWTNDKAEASASIRSRVEAEKAGEKEKVVGGIKSNQGRIDGLNEEIPAIQKQVGAYYEAIQAVASGANTGPFAGRMPSFSDASAWLDNVQQELGLAKISQYTFGSLSEAEGKWVRDSSIPQNMSEEFLGEFLLRKAEGAKRMLKARQFERAYREEFGKRPKDGMVDKILYEGGFTYGVPDAWINESMDEKIQVGPEKEKEG